MGVKNWDEIVAMVEEAVADAQPGELIRGRGWHQDKWTPVPTPNVESLPVHGSLSEVSPNNRDDLPLAWRVEIRDREWSLREHADSRIRTEPLKALPRYRADIVNWG